LCTPADVLGNQIVTGPCRAGDVVAISNVGAYGLTASLLSFLSRPAPTEVVLQDNLIVSASNLRYHRVPS
jgi:diaminopimelate decarboxylase